VLRDPSGERALEPETLVAFQSGPDGAHTFDEPGRVTPRVRTPPPTTERTAPRAFHVSEDDVALWRTSLGLQPLILQRLVRQRAWSVSTIRAFELGIDGDRITIPVRNPYHQLVGLLRYQPWGRERATKMLAAPGSQRQLLPHPTTEPSQRVVLVEGEPDMLAARSHDLPAIAIPGAETWKSEWAPELVGRDVTVALDCDEKGRAAARRIAQDLRDFAKTQVVDLAPNRTDGFDLTDWLRTATSLDLEHFR
jgi:Toprim-like